MLGILFTFSFTTVDVRVESQVSLLPSRLILGSIACVRQNTLRWALLFMYRFIRSRLNSSTRRFCATARLPNSMSSFVSIYRSRLWVDETFEPSSWASHQTHDHPLITFLLQKMWPRVDFCGWKCLHLIEPVCRKVPDRCPPKRPLCPRRNRAPCWVDLFWSSPLCFFGVMLHPWCVLMCCLFGNRRMKIKVLSSFFFLRRRNRETEFW